MKHSMSKAVVLVGLTLLAGGSRAATVTIDNLTASWVNVDPISIAVTGNGTGLAQMRWGTAASGSGQSGYDFQTASTPITNVVPPDSPVFDLGTWTHVNFPITGTTLNSATLVLGAEILVDSVSLGIKSFLFDFVHDETPNGSNPCANGEANNQGVNVNGCADIVDVTFNALSDTFLVDDVSYTLNVVAGSSHFETVEGQENAFTLQGNITAAVLPEPGVLSLLALGLAGVVVRRRRTA